MAKTQEVFKCPECDWEGKSKSALTQHMNKQHAQDPAAKLRASLGDIAPRPGGVFNPDKPLRAMPSGVPSIDHAIGIGGMPQGGIIEIFGPSRAGKTLTALTFSAQAQRLGGRVGYMDAEHAMTETFVQLVQSATGLNFDDLEYGEPRNGEQALEVSKKFIKTNLYSVWTIDSIPACIPQSMVDAEIGSSQARAAIARLMSEGLPVLDHVLADTECSLILVNHQKEKPGVQFGRSWYTPGGSAPEYYSMLRIRVWFGDTYMGKRSGKQIGHQVRFKIEKSKVGAPYSKASFDLYYDSDIRKDTGREVKPGIDIGSSWLSVILEEGRLAKSNNGQVYDTETAERLGTETEITERLEDPEDDLVEAATEIVYPPKFR